MTTYTSTSDISDDDGNFSSASSSHHRPNRNRIRIRRCSRNLDGDQDIDCDVMRKALEAVHAQSRRKHDVQMHVCDLLTDPYVSIPSLVQKMSGLVPALLGLNEQADNDDSNGRLMDDSDDDDDCSYYRAKITIYDEDDEDDLYSNDSGGHIVLLNDCHQSKSDNCDFNSRSSFSSHGSLSPGSSLHYHNHHRRLPKLPMVSDNTVDRLRQVFVTETIPFPNEELISYSRTGNGRNPLSMSSKGGCCQSSSKTGVVGKIEVFKYAMLGRTQPRNLRGRHEETLGKQSEGPSAEQTSRLEHLAEQLGKVIVNRRKQQDAERMLQKLQEANRRLVESQNLARIGQWELDLTMKAGESDSLFWSDAIYDIFRIPKTTFGASYEAFLNAIHPDDREYVDESYKNSLKTKEPYDIIHRLLFVEEPGGEGSEVKEEVRWVRETCRTEYDGDTPLYSVGVVQDITDSKLVNGEELKRHGAVVTEASTTEKTASIASPPTLKSPPISNEQHGMTEQRQQQIDVPQILDSLKSILASVYSLQENGTRQKLKAVQSCYDAINMVNNSSNSLDIKPLCKDIVDSEGKTNVEDENPEQRMSLHHEYKDHLQHQDKEERMVCQRIIRSSCLRFSGTTSDQTRQEEKQQQQQKQEKRDLRSFIPARNPSPLRTQEKAKVLFSKCA